MRNILGGLLALVGAAATLVSPWQPWYNGRHGSTYKFYEVFGSGITPSRSGIMDSVFLLFLIMAVLTAIGVLLRSRALVGFAAVVSFGFTILWMIRQGQAAGELTVTGANNRGLGSGLAWAFVGGLLMVIGSLVMVGRPRRVATAEPAVTRPAADQDTVPTRSTTPEMRTTAPADRTREAPPPAPAEQAVPTSAEQAPPGPAERTGTERLSKEERRLLGLEQDAETQPKKRD